LINQNDLLRVLVLRLYPRPFLLFPIPQVRIDFFTDTECVTLVSGGFQGYLFYGDTENPLIDGHLVTNSSGGNINWVVNNISNINAFSGYDLYMSWYWEGKTELSFENPTDGSFFNVGTYPFYGTCEVNGNNRLVLGRNLFTLQDINFQFQIAPINCENGEYVVWLAF